MQESFALKLDYLVFRVTWAGWNIGPRTISNYELVFVTAGQGKIAWEESTVTANPGDLICFYPGVRHQLWVDADPCMEFYGLHFTPRSRLCPACSAPAAFSALSPSAAAFVPAAAGGLPQSALSGRLETGHPLAADPLPGRPPAAAVRFPRRDGAHPPGDSADPPGPRPHLHSGPADGSSPSEKDSLSRGFPAGDRHHPGAVYDAVPAGTSPGYAAEHRFFGERDRRPLRIFRSFLFQPLLFPAVFFAPQPLPQPAPLTSPGYSNPPAGRNALPGDIFILLYGSPAGGISAA